MNEFAMTPDNISSHMWTGAMLCVENRQAYITPICGAHYWQRLAVPMTVFALMMQRKQLELSCINIHMGGFRRLIYRCRW